MAKAKDQERANYNDRIKHYHAMTVKILKQEHDITPILKNKKSGYEFRQLETAEMMINLASNYLVMNGISLSLLGQRSEESLNEARKAIYKCIIYIEGIVGNTIDAPFTDYDQQLAMIESVSPEQRYCLVRKIGIAIQLLKNAYGDNSKWRWAFVELEGRHATVTKNIIDLRNIFVNIDPRSPHYEPTFLHLKMIKKLLSQAADRYREKYELSTNRIDDFKMGISYLSALKRLGILTGDQIEAATSKKKLDTWTAKLNSDMTKQDKPYSGKKG